MSRSCIGSGAAHAKRQFECAVKTRYRQSDLAAACCVRPDDASAQVALERPARAVTPGQYAVFYDGEVCLGGGVIAAPLQFIVRRAARRTPGSNSFFSVEGS